MARTKTQAAATELPLQSPADPQASASPHTEQGAPGTPPAAEISPASEPSAVKRMAVMSDRQAGLRFYFDYQHHRGEIAFDAKPSPEVRSFLKENGFRWDADAQAWAVPIRFPQREQDRLAAKRTFHKCCEMVRTEKGIEQDSPPLPD